MSGIVTKHQLEQFIQNGRNKKDREYVLVDVREPSELQTQGNIESSINIPLGQLNDALKLSPEEFKAKYKTAKFGHGDFVIFSCKAGIRAQTACDVAEAQGFKNVHNYKGSAAEWFGL